MGLKIGARAVGEGHPTFVIAEIGSNHDGRLSRAMAMVELASLVGADAVKFQSFTVEGLVASRVMTAKGKFEPNPICSIIERLAVPRDWHARLKEVAEAAKIEFLSAPFDLERLDLLDALDVPAIKIASGDLTYGPLLKRVAATGRVILLSTGMATIDEIEWAVDLLESEGSGPVVLLHCVTSYPTPLEKANVSSVRTLADRFGLTVGLSDHSPGMAAALGAVALGAMVVEKHLTFDRSLPGPDHSFAMEPDEFKQMVREIRNMEKAIGSGDKVIGEEEQRERLVGRRSVLASVPITRGNTITGEMLKCVRPGGGISPVELDRIIGMKAASGFEQDEPLSWEKLEG